MNCVVGFYTNERNVLYCNRNPNDTYLHSYIELRYIQIVILIKPLNENTKYYLSNIDIASKEFLTKEI